MTDIDFYILTDDTTSGQPPAGQSVTRQHQDQNHEQSRQLTACRLAEKAYKLGHQVHIHTASASDSAQLDKMLWTFRDGSFVPHAIYQAGQDVNAPISIAHDAEPSQHHDVLINLAHEVPLFFSHFARVAEIIGKDEQEKIAGRIRYRFYRDRGYPLKSHNL